MSRVLVTGASGLLGSYVVKALADEAEIIGLDTRPPLASHAHVDASILDLDALVEAFEGVDCVLHIAAAANIASGVPEQIIRLNALGSWNVLEAALRAEVRRVVLCSSDSVMGNTVWKDFFWRPETLPVAETHLLQPADPYSLSKLMMEEAGRSYARRGLEVLALRPVFVFFPSMIGEVRAPVRSGQLSRTMRGRPCTGGRRPVLAPCRSARRRGCLPPGGPFRVARLRELLALCILYASPVADARQSCAGIRPPTGSHRPSSLCAESVRADVRHRKRRAKLGLAAAP